MRLCVFSEVSHASITKSGFDAPPFFIASHTIGTPNTIFLALAHKPRHDNSFCVLSETVIFKLAFHFVVDLLGDTHAETALYTP